MAVSFAKQDRVIVETGKKSTSGAGTVIRVLANDEMLKIELDKGNTVLVSIDDVKKERKNAKPLAVASTKRSPKIARHVVEENDEDENNEEEEEQEVVKRGRGRPRKIEVVEEVKRGRGRPRKEETPVLVKRGRGRPRKVEVEEVGEKPRRAARRSFDEGSDFTAQNVLVEAIVAIDGVDGFAAKFAEKPGERSLSRVMKAIEDRLRAATNF
jgi:hypothetical protein